MDHSKWHLINASSKSTNPLSWSPPPHTREDLTLLPPSHSHPEPHKHIQLLHLPTAPQPSHAGQEFCFTTRHSPALDIISVTPAALLLPTQLIPPTQFSHSPPCH